MADISACKGTGCLLKETCYRYLVEWSDYQSYFVDPPIKDGECEYYWKTQTAKKPNPKMELKDGYDDSKPFVKTRKNKKT